MLVERLLLEHYDEGYTLSGGRSDEQRVATLQLENFSDPQIERFIEAVTR